MESQPQNSEFRINPENFHPCICEIRLQSSFGPQHEKTCLLGFTNNKSADQPAHLPRLISAFVIHFFKSIISYLAASEISTFQLVSVAEETSLSLVLSETTKDRFCRDKAHLIRHAQLSSRARGLNFGRNLHLHFYFYCSYTPSIYLLGV